MSLETFGVVIQNNISVKDKDSSVIVQEKINHKSSIFSAEASAIFNAVQIVNRSTEKSAVIITDNRKQSKFHQIKDNVCLVWVLSHSSIDGNNILVDEIAKDDLNLRDEMDRNHHLSNSDFKIVTKNASSKIKDME